MTSDRGDLYDHDHQNATQQTPKKGCGSHHCGCSHKGETEKQESKHQAKSEEPTSLKMPVEEPVEVIEQDEFKDKYLRLLAENENLRRRIQRESQEAIRFATQKVILDLLEPFDSFEKALFYAGYSPSEDVRNWAVGFKMIHQQFKEWLQAQGVYSYPSKGEQFNAQLHEAVEVLSSKGTPEGTVLEELIKGYKMHDRILRPAKVAIAGKIANHDSLVDDAESELSDEELKKSTF